MDYPTNEIKSCDENCNKAIDNNDYESALREALKGYELAKELSDHVYIMYFVGYLRITSEKLFNKLSKNKVKNSSNDVNKCSFCGKREDQVNKLVAGVDAFICDSCVEVANEATK